MTQVEKEVYNMSDYDITIMCEAINHINGQKPLYTRKDVKNYLQYLCDYYGVSPLLAFATHICSVN